MRLVRIAVVSVNATVGAVRSNVGRALELTRAAASVISRLEMRGHTFGTVLAGGMFKVIPWLAADVERRLAEVAPRATVKTLDVEPAVGAVRLAVRELREGVRVPAYVEGVAAQ